MIDLSPWRENLLWHFLRTGDYFCCPAAHPETNGGCYAQLMVGGMDEDRPKLEAIRYILGGNTARTDMLMRRLPMREYELVWYAREHSEKYLKWLLDKWDNHNIIDSHGKRRYVIEALEACNAYN